MNPHVIVYAPEPHLTRLIALHLLRSDFDVWTASSIDAALDRVAKVAPQVAIVDLDIPAHQLERLLANLDSGTGLSRKQIIGFTHRPLDDALDNRITRILPKPLNPRVLRRLVSELVTVGTTVSAGH